MKKNKLPYIGISGNFSAKDGQHLLANTYVHAVLKAGGCPVILPPYGGEELSKDLIDKTLSQIDGIIFSGGGDFTPELIGEQRIEALGSLNPLRDEYEFPLIRRALDLQLPILGICRGEQLLNLALGGRIYQDLPSEYEGSREDIAHSQSQAREISTHDIVVEADSLLARILSGGDQHFCGDDQHFSGGDQHFCGDDQHFCGTDAPSTEYRVNSFHHQAIKTCGKALRVTARGKDGVVEAVESTEYKPVIGVQWHPECLVDHQPEMLRLFEWLCQEALLYRESRDCMEKSISIDLHCDVPMFFEGNYDLLQGGNIERGKIDFDAQGDEALELVDSRVDLQKMQDGQLDAVVMAAYIKQLARDEQGLQAARDKALRLLKEVEDRAANLEDDCLVVKDEESLRACKASKRRALFLGIENGYALGKDLQLIPQLARQGLLYLTLCHNGHNDICDSASQANNPEHNGLSLFGRQVVEAMNRHGVIVDMSHASEKSFYDALEHSKTPIICSHSSAYTLCEHRRNLKDEQIKALAEKGGMMGICLYSGFLAKNREASIHDAVAHIDYVKNLVGIDYVGIGSDFDGGGGIIGCNHSGEIIGLVRELLRIGYSHEDISKVLGGNFLRVMNEVQSYAKSCSNE